MAQTDNGADAEHISAMAYPSQPLPGHLSCWYCVEMAKYIVRIFRIYQAIKGIY